MKSLLFVLVLPFVLMVNQSDHSTGSGYIQLRYTGDADKPCPVVIFYLIGSIDTAHKNFTYKIEVTESEFDAIITSLKANRVTAPSDALPAPVEVTIANNEQMDSLFFKDKESVRNGLNGIIQLFKGTSKEEMVREPVENLLRRLGVIKLPDSN